MARHAGLFLWIALWLAVARFCGLLFPLQDDVVVSGPTTLPNDHADWGVHEAELSDLTRTASHRGAIGSVIRPFPHPSPPRAQKASFDASQLNGTFRNEGPGRPAQLTGQFCEPTGSAVGMDGSRKPQFRKVLVAPHALVVVLSLDLSGAVHRFQYRSGQPQGHQSPQGESSALKTVSVTGSGAEYSELAVPRDIAAEWEESFLRHAWGQHPADAVLGNEDVPADRRIAPLIRPVSLAGSFRTGMGHSAEESSGLVDGVLVQGGRGWMANACRPAMRCFRMPRFADGQAREELCRADEFLRAEGVSVFLDSSLPESELDAEEIRNAGTRIVALCEGGLRRLVEMQVGPIRDVDGDGRLSVVLTRLEADQSSGSIPVRGCVRESDFLDASSGPPGDIIYLDLAVPEAAELAGLLAHEMTHAAMYSRLLDRREKGQCELSLPGWFHEAIAHSKEHQLAGRGPVFAERLRMYQSNPAAAPVCTNPLWLSYSASRGGPRVAGARFLEAMLRPDASLADIIGESRNFDEILERCLGTSMSEALVSWSTCEAARLVREVPERIPVLKTGESETQRIFGTAFLVLQCGPQPLELEIGCEDTSDWNLTVIER